MKSILVVLSLFLFLAQFSAVSEAVAPPKKEEESNFPSCAGKLETDFETMYAGKDYVKRLYTAKRKLDGNIKTAYAQLLEYSKACQALKAGMQGNSLSVFNAKKTSYDISRKAIEIDMNRMFSKHELSGSQNDPTEGAVTWAKGQLRGFIETVQKRPATDPHRNPSLTAGKRCLEKGILPAEKAVRANVAELKQREANLITSCAKYVTDKSNPADHSGSPSSCPDGDPDCADRDPFAE